MASSLYWLGRYLERAENVTRLLLTTEDLSTEIRGFNEKLAEAQWTDLLGIFPGAELGGGVATGPDAVALGHLGAFFVAPMNGYSIHYSLRKARENARAVREALTVEVFVSLNDAYRRLEDLGRRDITDLATYRDALASTLRDLLAVVGAIDHTLSRDHGWDFLKLGESIERVYRTALVLSVKLRTLMGPGTSASPALVDTQWRGLLRALSCLENYRKVFGARMEPMLVTQFIVFDAEAPRSLRSGTGAVTTYLEHVGGGSLTPPARVIGRLTSRLRYEDEQSSRDPTAFIDQALAEITRAHDAIEQHFFGS